jgi:hypothetical protein
MVCNYSSKTVFRISPAGLLQIFFLINNVKCGEGKCKKITKDQDPIKNRGQLFCQKKN